MDTNSQETESKSPTKSRSTGSMTSMLHQSADLSADHKHMRPSQSADLNKSAERKSSEQKTTSEQRQIAGEYRQQPQGHINPVHLSDPRLNYKHKTDHSYETSETRKVLQEFFKHHGHKDLLN